MILILGFHMNKDLRQSKSFTLLEILVATTIFMVVSVIALAVITSVINSSAKTQAILNVQESGRLAMEMMTGQIKVAKSFNIDSTKTQVTVVDNNNVTKIFQLYGTNCASGSPCYLGVEVAGNISRLTSPTVNVESLQFTGVDYMGSNSAYIQIITKIKTTSTNVKESQTQELQTSVVPFYQDGLNNGWSYN